MMFVRFESDVRNYTNTSTKKYRSFRRIRYFLGEEDTSSTPGGLFGLFGGTDKAPNPVEYALAALAACQEITYHMHAAALGIPINEVSVTLEGKLDLRGFFSVAPHPRPGFTEIVGSVRIDSPASADQLKHLKEVVDAHCPVLDLLRNATPVRIALE